MTRHALADRIKTVGVLNRNMSTLAATSRDKNSGNQALCSRTEPAYDMDNVKRDWLNGCGASDHTMKSADALMVWGDTMYLIEFKNGAQDNVKRWQVEAKILASILMLCDLLGCTCSTLRSHLEFLYVIRSKDAIRHAFARKAGRGGREAGRDGQEGDGGDGPQQTATSYERALYREGHAMRGEEFDRFVDGLAARRVR